jgi:hypothetical protein
MDFGIFPAICGAPLSMTGEKFEAEDSRGAYDILQRHCLLVPGNDCALNKELISAFGR